MKKTEVHLEQTHWHFKVIFCLLSVISSNNWVAAQPQNGDSFCLRKQYSKTKARTKWPEAVVSHLSTKRSHNLKTSSAHLPEAGLDESMLHQQKYNCPWWHNRRGCCSLQRCRQGVGYGQHSVWLYLAEVVDLHWTLRTFLLLGTAWEDVGKAYDAAGPHSLLWSITEMLQEFDLITSQFLASVSVPIKQEWCHQLQDGG